MKNDHFAEAENKKYATAPDYIKVGYKYVDGAHFFVAKDQFAAGLCVAHADLYKAFVDVSEQLEKICKHNHNMEVNFKPAFSFEKLQQYVSLIMRDNATAPYPHSITPCFEQAWENEHRMVS